MLFGYVITVLGACAPHPGPTRDVLVTARGMAFFADGNPTPNPAIRLRAGERVRLVLRNEAPGLIHDFAIPDWEISIDPTRVGEQRETTFEVPDEPGRTAYQSRLHAGTMKGVLEVTR